MQTIVRLLDEHRFLERVCVALASYGEEQRSVRLPDDRLELKRFLDFLHGNAVDSACARLDMEGGPSVDRTLRLLGEELVSRRPTAAWRALRPLR